MSGTVAVVLDYRDAARTHACVRALLAEGLDRILVWDNSDDGGATARALAALLAADADARVGHATGSANLGFAAGVNAALARLAAGGTFARALLVNNDALVERGAVDALGRALDARPDAYAAAARVTTGGRAATVMHYHPWLASVFAAPLPGALAYAPGTCVLLDLAKTGTTPFDEAFFMYGEDVALAAAMRARGWAIAAAPDARARHEGSGSSGGGSAFYELHTARAHLLLARALRVGIAGRVAGRAALAARALVRAVRQRSTVPFAALRQALRDVGP